MDYEITTSAERNAPGETEPTMTLSQLQGLLREAAALERAQRPIILHTAPTPATIAPVTVLPTSAQVPPRHPGVDITIPVQAPDSVAWAVVRHRTPHAPGWGIRLAVTSMLITLAAGASAGATDGNPGAVTAVALGIAGVLGGTARAVHEQNREQ